MFGYGYRPIPKDNYYDLPYNDYDQFKQAYLNNLENMLNYILENPSMVTEEVKMRTIMESLREIQLHLKHSQTTIEK